MKIYIVRLYVSQDGNKFKPAGVHYYSTKEKANARIDDEIAMHREHVRSVRDDHGFHPDRRVRLYFETGYVYEYILRAEEVE